MASNSNFIPASGEGMSEKLMNRTTIESMRVGLKENYHNPSPHNVDSIDWLCDTALYALSLREQREWMVEVPNEPTEAMMKAAEPAFELINSWCAEMQIARGRKPNWSPDNPPLLQAWRLMLAAAPAAGREERER